MNKDTLQKVLDIGIALSKEKDIDCLMEQILNAAMDITRCDGGTLYIRNGNMLEFKIMITKSRGIHQGGSGRNYDAAGSAVQRECLCLRGVIS